MLRVFLAVVVSAVVAIPAIAAERRLALVVGVADYLAAGPLENTLNDSRLIAESLGEIGFDVDRLENPTAAELKSALSRFAFDAEVADVALIYFAGHGIEFAGRNYLLPADAAGGNRKAFAESAVSLDELLRAVDRSRQLRIVILDSCRNDPFEGDESLTVSADDAPRGGLAQPSPERGSLVAFAAQAGEVAFDGGGDNSPFAAALAETLTTPDLEISLMFRRVRDRVLDLTQNRQEPYTYGSLPGDPYFLAGRQQAVNQLADAERRNGWSRLSVDEETQLTALAETGDVRALKGLAYMRLDPKEDRHSPEQAVRLLEKAAGRGDPEAQFELARLYERGIGVEQDTARALELFEAAAEGGFADAINDLGFLHFQGGLGILRDQDKALGYFRRAAELRHPQAMFNYAALIDDGLVAGAGAAQAAEYLFQALRAGNPDVLDQLSDNPRMFKSATRAALQAKLKEKAFYEGAIDAAFGPQTVRGLRRAYGLTE